MFLLSYIRRLFFHQFSWQNVTNRSDLNKKYLERERERDLVVEKKKEILRERLEFMINRTKNGSDSTFNGTNSRS
jgi:hypothetical protein